MRPGSIALAEAVYGTSILLVVIGTALSWAAASAVYGPSVALGAVVFAVALPLILLLLATRRRSRVALWLLVAWTVFSLWSVGLQVLHNPAIGLAGIVTTLQLVLMVVGLGLLFGHQARAWFAERAVGVTKR